MSNSRQDTPSLDSMEVSPPYVYMAETSSNQTIHTTLPPYLPGTTTIPIYSARSTHVPPNCQEVDMATFQQFTKNQRVETKLFFYKEANPTADHSTINIFRAIIEDQDEKHQNILQSHSMLPEEDGSHNIKTNMDLSHLDAQDTEMFTDIR